MKKEIGPRYYGRRKAIDPTALKELRVRRGLTQETLAERADVSLKAMQKAEQGKNIEAENAAAIEKALGVLVDSLFTSANAILGARPERLHFGVQAIPSPSDWFPAQPLPSASVIDPTVSGGAQRPEGRLWLGSNSEKLWMARSVFLPIRKEDLDMQTGKLGLLRRIEIPRAALAEAVMDRPDLLMDASVYEHLRDVWSQPKKYKSIIGDRPALKNWVEGIWAPVSRSSKDLERRQLRKFLAAMQAPNIEAGLLPDFTDADVSCWRIFVQAFPESISLLEAVSLEKKIPLKHRMAIALLASTLATTGNWRISSRAKAIARRLNREVAVSRLYSYAKYRVVRQFFYAACEAGEAPSQNVIDFFHRHPVEWEFLVHRAYYKDATEMSHARAVVQKCERPVERDLGTKQLSLYHQEQLPKHLVDRIYRILDKV